MSPIQDTKKIFVHTEYITVGPDPEFFLSILTTEKGLYWLKNSDFVIECKSIAISYIDLDNDSDVFKEGRHKNRVG